MTKQEKHTIYIDIDDEITAIIDKVKHAPDKIVALVLPKRATVLQSIVNMKLLKKSALAAKKSLVLVTSEVGLLPLAGAVGLHVAKSLESKPIIPLAPDHGDSEEAVITEENDEPEIDPTKSVGALAAGVDDDETETIELDEAADEETGDVPVAGKPKSKHKFSVPNFDRFRLSFFLAILAVILLIVGWVFAAVILPKATVVIKTDTSTTVSNISFTANTALKDLDVTKALLPAIQKEIKKTDTEKTTATGKRDTGAKAIGSVVFYNCSIDDKLSDTDRTIAAGTAISSGGLNFTTAENVLVHPSNFSSNVCQKNKPSAAVKVTATSVGTESNLASGTSFTVSSNSAYSAISDGAFSGGTPSVIVKVVSQDDVDAAAAKMAGRLDNAVKKELGAQLQAENLKALDETLIIGAPTITASPAVGAEVSGEVTVTQATTYSILGVKQEYLNELIKKDVSTKIDTTKQVILDNGLNAAAIRLTNRKSPAEAQLSLQTLVIAGPELNPENIKNEILGKKRGDAIKLISSKPGVKDVTITYSPFWVYSTPKSHKKITITIEKPAVTKPAVPSTSSGTAP